MSIHSNIPQDVIDGLKKQKMRSTLLSLLTSILVLLMIGMILALLTIAIPHKEIDILISYEAPAPEEEIIQEKRVMTTSRREVQPPSSSSAVSNIITSASISNISLPDTDNVAVESLDFGEIDDFGAGDGFEIGDGFSGSEGDGMMTAFGTSSKGGMKGYLFDIKQTNTKRENDLGEFYASLQDQGSRPIRFTDTLSDTIKKDYSLDSFKEFYKSKKALNLTYLVVPQQSALVGPESFEAEDEVKPSGWVVVYEGIIVEEAQESIRFLGRFDDILIVYVNDRVVLDGSWQDGYTGSFNDMTNCEHPIKINGTTTLKVGNYIKLKKDDKLRIVVGEVPGGYLGGGLFIEERGGKNPGLEKDGTYKLIPFTTKPLSKSDKALLSEMDIPIETDHVPVFSTKETPAPF